MSAALACVAGMERTHAMNTLPAVSGISITLVIVGITPAFAHPGHLAEAAGHGHWLGAAALGAAIAIGLVAGLKAREKAKAKDADDADNDTPQEA